MNRRRPHLPLDSLDRRLIALAVPAFGALAAEPLYRLVDTVIIGRVGTSELGGVALATGVLSLVIAGSNFLAYGTTQRVANRLGADDREAAAEVGVQAIWLALIIGWLAVPLLFFGARPFVAAMGGSADVIPFAVTYLRISALGVPWVVVGLAAQGAQRGASSFRPALVILVMANVINLLLEVVLVFGFDLGVAGAAWSTVVAQVIAGALLMWTTRPFIAAARSHRPRWNEMRVLLAAGRHLLLRVGSILAVFTGATSIAARIDDATLAAHQIAMTAFLFLALSLDALAVPTQTLVAEEVGQGGSLAGEIARRSVRLSAVVGLIMAVSLALASPLLSRAFSNDPAVIDRATVALFVLAMTLVPGAVAFATDGSLIGAGDYRFLGRAALCYLIAIAPIAALVLVVPGLGIAGIWFGLAAWMLLRAIVNLRRVALILPTSLGRNATI